MKRTLAITNPAAGSHDEDAVALAVSALRDGGLEVEVVATQSAADLDDALDALDGRDVLVVGGDGSLHAIVSALARRGELDGPTVGLIPLGTGNDFARGIGLPLDPEAAAAVVLAGQARGVDLLQDDAGGWVINAVHIGVGAEAGREAEALKPKLGKLGYAVGAVLAGFKTDGHQLRVVVDGATVATGRRRVLQVGIGNGRFVGGGTELTPDASTVDGRANVVVSYAVSPMSRLLYGVRLTRGTHDERDDVIHLTGSTIAVTGEAFWCNADGELSGPTSSRSWQLMPAALTMLLPDAA